MKIIGFFGVFFFFSVAFSQEKSISTTLLQSELLEADTYVGQDKFGHRYYIKNNVLNKKSKQGILQYKNVALGKITRVDLLNPLKIVVFYEKFNTVVTLDNQLNETATLYFSTNQNNPIVASAVGLAAQNKLWVFNNLNQQLGLFEGSKNHFQPLASPFSTAIKFYQTDYNYFYWVTQNNQAYYCDLFGNISFLGSIPEADAIQFLPNHNYIYSHSNHLYWHHTVKNETHAITIDKKTFQSFHFSQQILTIFTNVEISTYKILLP